MTNPRENDPFDLGRLDDPDFFEQESARLTGIDITKTEKGNLVPSPEVQEAFRSHANTRAVQITEATGNNTRIWSNTQLLFASLEIDHPQGPIFSRSYDKPDNEFGFAELVGLLYTHPGISYPLNPRPNYVEINKEGEADFDQLGLSFHSNKLDASFCISFDDRFFALNYNERGGVRYIEFYPSGSVDHYDPDAGECTIDEEVILELVKKGKINLRDAANNIYEVNYDRKSGRISFVRSKDGEVKDSLSFLFQINNQEIFKTLVPKPLLDGMYDAPPELDEAWKSITTETFGIIWHRPSE